MCLSLQDAQQFSETHGLPIVLKPVDNRGSFGVSKVDNISELSSAFTSALIHSHSRQVIAESYISGTHLTVDGYVYQQAGAVPLAVASKKKLPDKKAIMDGEIVYPAEFEQRIYQKCLNVAENTARALGLDFGFFHGEFILTADGSVYLTEMANRGGGIYTSEIIVPHFYGQDILTTYIMDALGTPSTYAKEISRKPVKLTFFSIPGEVGQKIKRIHGLKQARALSNVLALQMMIQPGDTLSPVENGAQRHGAIIVSGETREALILNTEKALSELRYEYA